MSALSLTIALYTRRAVLPDHTANEYQETVNKAAALGRAIDLAETAFTD